MQPSRGLDPTAVMHAAYTRIYILHSGLEQSRCLREGLHSADPRSKPLATFSGRAAHKFVFGETDSTHIQTSMLHSSVTVLSNWKVNPLCIRCGCWGSALRRVPKCKFCLWQISDDGAATEIVGSLGPLERAAPFSSKEVHSQRLSVHK